MEVTLSEILNAREKRVQMQRTLLSSYNTPLICFSMNIAGPVKTSPEIERAFFEGKRLLDCALCNFCVKHTFTDVSPTGCQAMYCVDADAAELKRICVEIETASRLGRLFDMDVLTQSGEKLERQSQRECLVCGKVGRECAVSRAHSVEHLQMVSAKIIDEYFLSFDAERFSLLCRDCLLQELYTTPKPGLVDRRNCGSHPDMTPELFERSANALKEYFRQSFLLGALWKEGVNEKLFLRLRRLGLDAEDAMYSASDGVNTHKGAVFCFGLILCALGLTWSVSEPYPSIDSILSLSASLAEFSLSDLSESDADTAGKRLFLSHKIRGVRGEAASGFHSVKAIALPFYENALAAGASKNDAGVISLLALIANLDDTTLYKRGGDEGVKYARSYARSILEECEQQMRNGRDGISALIISQIEKMDDEFIERNLSVGGCADLLSVCFFLHEIKEQKKLFCLT